MKGSDHNGWIQQHKAQTPYVAFHLSALSLYLRVT